jgi:hypothetical protein
MDECIYNFSCLKVNSNGNHPGTGNESDLWENSHRFGINGNPDPIEKNRETFIPVK